MNKEKVIFGFVTLIVCDLVYEGTKYLYNKYYDTSNKDSNI